MREILKEKPLHDLEKLYNKLKRLDCVTGIKNSESGHYGDCINLKAMHKVANQLSDEPPEIDYGVWAKVYENRVAYWLAYSDYKPHEGFKGSYIDDEAFGALLAIEKVVEGKEKK